MSDKFQGGVLAGAIDVSMPVLLLKSVDSTEQTGKVAADMTLSYWRQGGVRVAVAASDLAAVNSAHSDGGVKEVDATNMPGSYRSDWPDAAFATGADWVTLSAKVAATFVWTQAHALTTNVIQTGDSFVRVGAAGVGLTAITGKTDNLPTDPADQSLVIAATNALAALLPAALVGGRLDASLGAVNGDATAAANLAKTTRAIGRGTVGAASTTISIVTSAFAPAGAVPDQFKGRIVTFDSDTTTVALRGQSTDVTASSNAAAPVLAVTALTTAPVSGDTFSLT